MSDKADRPTDSPSVVREIMEWILRYADDRHLGSGDRLPSEHDIATATTAGRTSVREALQRLIGKGVVQVRAGRGYYWDSRARPSIAVTGVSLGIQAIRELTEARLVVECECAALAAVRATPEDIARIDAFLCAMETKSWDIEVYADAIELHRMIVAAARNLILSEMAKVIFPKLVAHGAELAREMPGRVELQVARHRELWTKIRAGDPDAARTAMAAHIRDSASMYLLPYESRGILDASS